MIEEKKIQKVYLAILNDGTMRSEMIASIIPVMQKTKGVKLIWEHPSKTWANPISSNRNKIVKRFLETDCDYLLMIDNDVVPLHNPCELVFADKDIVGSPARVRSAGRITVWTAYIPHSGGYGYSAIDLDSFDDMFDILQVSIVGTGCILIKRKVLEALKAPFHSEFDEDGVQTFGTDFAFCRKATQAGFKVYTTTHRRCEHFKTVGFNDSDGWDLVDYFDRSNNPYDIPWGGYSISQKTWHFVKAAIEHTKSKKILEFGCGLSSFLMSEFCEVISYETDQEYARKMRLKCTNKNNLTIKIWDGVTCSDLTELIANKIDLVFVDGPKAKTKGGIGRDVAIKIAAQVSNHVIIHDAGRIEEERIQRKYLRSIFKLVGKSGSHIARCHYWIRRPYPVTLEEVVAAMKK